MSCLLNRYITLIISLAVLACTTSNVEYKEQNIRSLSDDEAIAVLGYDVGFPSCLREGMQAASSKTRYVSATEIRNAFFPWLEPHLAPNGIKGWVDLLSKAKVRERIASLKLRYLVVVAGTTETKNAEGLMFGGASYGGGGIFGFLQWDKNTDLTAVVWDLQQGQKAANFNVTAKGTALVPAFVLPIPLIPPTQTIACNELGQKLMQVLSTP